jgi:DNA-binding NtrC family response regulator
MKEMLLPSLKSKTVLYVEDEALIAMDGEAILRDMGFEQISVFLSFRDAQAAISSQSFDLALLDINLGGGETSLPLADALLTKGTRIMFASGYNSSEGLVDHFKVPLVQKPFDETSLRTAVMKTLCNS